MRTAPPHHQEVLPGCGGGAGGHGDVRGGVGAVVWGGAGMVRWGRVGVGAGAGREDCCGQRGANGGGRAYRAQRNEGQKA